MNLKEAIEELQTGTRHYKLIVLNQESKDCVNQCKALDFDGFSGHGAELSAQTAAGRTK